jgi:hypothetical protein
MEEDKRDDRIEENVRRTVGLRALKVVRGIVDEIEREEAARRKLLRAYWAYGWIILLLAVLALARYMGVI